MENEIKKTKREKKKNNIRENFGISNLGNIMEI